MPSRLLGVAIRGDKAPEVLTRIEQAEHLGLHAAWMTTGGLGGGGAGASGGGASHHWMSRWW